MITNTIILLILVMCSAFFSCAETAFMTISRLKAETLAKQNVRGAATLIKLKENPRLFIITILIGNNLANTAASALATVLATNTFGSSGIGIATGAMTFILLTFGEIIPKSFATAHAEKIILPIAAPSILAIKVLYPLVMLFEWMTTTVLKFFGASKKTELFSEAELRTLVEIGHKEKSLGSTEKEFIEGVLEFKQTVVKEIMTPKRRMFMLDENLSIRDAIQEINKREHSRIPVYRGSKEHIISVIYLKDILQAIEERKQEMMVSSIAKKPLFVEENYLIKQLFKELKGRHVHIAIVLNKKRELKGLVTMEDIIEEIVGDIFDEKDISPALMKRVGKDTIIVHGDTEIEDVNKFFNIRIPFNAQALTINQFLETRKRKEWQEGMKIRWNELTFIIKNVEEKKPVNIFINKR